MVFVTHAILQFVRPVRAYPPSPLPRAPEVTVRVASLTKYRDPRPRRGPRALQNAPVRQRHCQNATMHATCERVAVVDMPNAQASVAMLGQRSFPRR